MSAEYMISFLNKGFYSEVMSQHSLDMKHIFRKILKLKQN